MHPLRPICRIIGLNFEYQGTFGNETPILLNFVQLTTWVKLSSTLLVEYSRLQISTQG